jgi:isoquinoline 1-oxidoreductase beta subunit
MNQIQASPVQISRRNFMVGTSAMASGGLALGLNIFSPKEAQAQSSEATPEIGIWVVIKPDDTCVIRIVRSEMGQGTRTGLAQLVAEELECDWSKVTTESPTPGQNLKRKRAWGDMSTGGSRGIRTSQDYVRRGGAVARMMLVQAAANEWGVPVAELATSNSIIAHAASGRKTSYGKVASAAAKLPVPDMKNVVLKDPRSWKIAGKSVKRLDTADKLNGQKKYGIDIKMDGMLCASVMDCPVFGGKLVSFDDSKVKTLRGVKAVVRVDDTTVAVVADTWWRAKNALLQLPIVWDEGPNAKVNSAQIALHLKEGLTAPGNYAGRNEGDAKTAIANAAKKVEATYSSPFLSHAPMEPMNCTARWTADRAEVWTPTQNAEASLTVLAETAGLPLEKCDVHVTDLGGAFGRKGGQQDFVSQAINIAKQFPGTPIKMIWTREEDQTHDYYRPISQCHMKAGLDDKGNLVGMTLRSSGQSINAWVNPSAIKDGKDERQLQGFWKEPGDAQLGYTIPNLLTEYAIRNTHVPVGPWRGVNTNQNGVYMECFMEEVARAAGKDSLAFRQALMQNHPKHLQVLNAAAEKGDWGKPAAPGVFRGIAQFMGYGAYSAAVAEVTVSPKGEVKVLRMVLATNAGHFVNPHQVAAQVEGGVVMGLSAAFFGECTVENGRIQQKNFDTYRLLKMAEMPKVETILVPTYDFWGGVGEPTICVVAPAVINAISAAIGKPLRDLPLKNAGLKFV